MTEVEPQIVYVESRSNGMAVASLILGIVGTLGALIPVMFFFGWGLGVTGFILGCIALSQAKKFGGVRKTMSKWGIVLSIAAISLGTAGFVILQNAVNDVDESISNAQKAIDDLDSWNACMDAAETEVEMDAC